MQKVLAPVQKFVRSIMRLIAAFLNGISRGKLSPNLVTLIGLAAHIPIAMLISQGVFVWAAIALLVFGLFDTLDGELARLQKKASPRGMVLDSVTDRIKEVMLFAGIGVYFVRSQDGLLDFVVWTIVALGGSLLGSYVQAKGDIALSDKSTPNKKFRGGFLPFELRMSALIIGLFFNVLPFVVVLIALLSWATVLQRLNWVMRALK